MLSAGTRARRLAVSRSSEGSTDSADAEPAPLPSPDQSAEAAQPPRRSQRRQADSTDWISSQLTRRFGLAGGLAYLGFLTFGVVSEQIKTRLEVAADERGTRVRDSTRQSQPRTSQLCCCSSVDLSSLWLLQDVENAQAVTLPSGVQYTDLRIGGGQQAARGLLVILDLKLFADGELIQVRCPACSTTHSHPCWACPTPGMNVVTVVLSGYEDAGQTDRLVRRRTAVHGRHDRGRGRSPQLDESW